MTIEHHSPKSASLILPPPIGYLSLRRVSDVLIHLCNYVRTCNCVPHIVLRDNPHHLPPPPLLSQEEGEWGMFLLLSFC